MMNKCGAYDIDSVLDLAPSQIEALASFLREQQRREIADIMYAVRTAMWAKKSAFRSAIERLEIGKEVEKMKPGEQRISGFKMSVKQKGV